MLECLMYLLIKVYQMGTPSAEPFSDIVLEQTIKLFLMVFRRLHKPL